MFSNINKPAFGTGTSTPSFGFGTNTTANQAPFGQSQLFGKTATTTGFGASAPLFGSTAQQSSGALFSSSSVPSFGATPQAGFGTSLFGQQQNPSGGNGLFANTSATTFGQQNKTAGFGFGASTTTPLFGQQQPQNFQPSTSSGVFGNTPGFGGTTQIGTVIKFNPVTGTDTMQKSGITHSISTKHHCITCMKEYEAKSLEELRWEDYQCNRRGPQQQNSFGAPPFGAAVSSAPSLFGQTENKPAFGQSTTFGAGNGFGMTNQPNQQSLFGKPAGAFGTTPTTNAFGGFNSSAPAFGANTGVKPFGTQPTQNVFGAPTTQPSAFGGSTFFGQANAPNTGSFFNKPAQTAFNSQQPVFTFGQQTTAQSSLFQPSKTTTGFQSFGQTNLTSNSGFGQQPNIFSQAPQNPFNAFQKPAQTPFGQPLQPGFGIGTQPGTSTFFGANKPLFGGTAQNNFFTPPSSGFLMQQQQQPLANPSIGIDLQPQPDFHTVVEQLYETFPHREIFDGIQVKSYASNNETTNPTILREIIENAPLPVSPPDNISKLRIFPKPKQTIGNNSSKFSLLENITPPTPQNNFVLKNSTGKRLVLRKMAPRSEKDMLEEYKSMSSADGSKNRSLFKNTVLEELSGSESPKFGTNEQDSKPKSPPSVKEDILSPLSTRLTYDLDKLKENAKNIDKSAPAENTSQSPKLSVEKNQGSKTVRFMDKFDSSIRTDSVGSLLQRHMEMLDDDGEDPSSASEDDDPNITSTTQRCLKINPCGIKLTRPEYYTVPPLDEIHKYKTESGACLVKGFKIGRYGYGNVYFPDQMDIANLDLDEIIHFRFREVTLYPDENKKPPVGQGLNRPAQVTLDHVWPRHPVTHEIIKDPKEIAADNFLDRLILLTEKQHAELIDYRPDTGAWVFSVAHFSKYRYSDVDDEEIAQELEKAKRDREMQRKAMEDAKAEASKSDSVARGLGGIPQYETYMADGPGRDIAFPPQSHTHARLAAAFSGDFKSAMVMKSAFFDEESISDDVSSSDIGIVHHFSIPSASVIGSATRATGFRRRNNVPEPKYYALRNRHHVVPIQRSLLASRNYMDMAVFKGRSFKVGWGRGVTFTTVTTPTSLFGPHVINERCTYRPGAIMRLEIGNVASNYQKMNLEKHLQIMFEESSIQIDSSEVPLFVVNKGFRCLLRHQDVAARLDEEDYTEPLSYYRQVWNLCLALWGPNSATATDRREQFSQWLEDAATPHVKNELGIHIFQKSVALKNIFVYLTGHRIDEAVELAMERGYPRLSALISQASAHESARLDINEQLANWQATGVINNIEKDIMKIYMFLGGVPMISNINVCENLDWKRALAFHLWYMCPPGISLIHAACAYRTAFEELGYANRPSPANYQFTSDMVCDILYHIIQLFANLTRPLSRIINPISYTEDPLDYRLSWLLLQVFSALKVGTISEDVSNAVHISFASQLEDLGYWEWSVFILLFIKDKSAKTNAIMSVLDRNLDPNRASKDNVMIEDLLVNNFKIPPKWIHTVLANKASSHSEKYKHLILTDKWLQAHQIAIKHLIPDFISTGQCDKLSKVLKSLIPGKRCILHWNTQAGLVLDFLKIHETITVNKEHITEFDLRQLKTDLTGLCTRTKYFPIASLKQILAITELSRFLAILLYILYCDLQPFTRVNLESATNLISVLVMPPDYKQDELAKYIQHFLKLDNKKK